MNSNQEGETIRVLIADDHSLIRAGIRALLKNVSGLEIVAEAENGYEAREALRRFMPDVAILDIEMPGPTGIELAEELCQSGSSIRVLILSGHDDPDYVDRALEAGADAYVLKDFNPPELIEAIRAVHAGHPTFDRRLIQKLAKASQKETLSARKLGRMTARERRVLQLVVSGMTNQEVAAQLGISVRTVETHRKNMMQKLGVHSAVDLVRLAVERGLLSDSVK